MDNLAVVINEILRDPSSMQKVKGLAQSLGLDTGAAPAQSASMIQPGAQIEGTYTPVLPPAPSEIPAAASGAGMGGVDPPAVQTSSTAGTVEPGFAGFDPSALGGILNLLDGKNIAPILELFSGSGRQNDPRVQLLHALRPFLSTDKHVTLDRTIMALMIVSAGKLFFASGNGEGRKDV